MIPYKADVKFCSPLLENTKQHGGIETQMEAFLRERVTGDFAKRVVYQETEDQFRLKKDDETSEGMWRGEYWGKWIIGACEVCRYKKDEVLKEFIRKGAHALLDLQEADGYIGTYKNKKFFLPPDPEVNRLGRPWKTNAYNWNIWCRKYTLWGLVESYMLTQDERILYGAQRFADQLIGMLKEENVHLFDTGILFGLPSGSIIKPMLILYRLTEDKKYLDFCTDAVQDWEREDGKAPNLIKNALDNKPVHTWYPEPHNWAKAYEMMSCLEGLIELYRLTGEEKYFETVRRIHSMVEEHEKNVMFSVGFNDKFSNAKEWINAISEPCDVIHYMRLSYELFRHTGEAHYMDSFEKAYLNAFLAGAFSDGKWGARGVRSVGRHLVATYQSGMAYSHCCVNNMPRAFMNALKAFVMEKAGDLYVNLFTEYACTISGTSVKIGGSYLENGRVLIEIDSECERNVYIRIPEWSKNTTIQGNVIHNSGNYIYVSVGKGTSVIEVQFDMSPRIVDFPYMPEDYPDDAPQKRRFLAGENTVPESFMLKERRSYVLYGPLLLAKSLKNGNTKEEMFGSITTICGRNFKASIESIYSGKVRNSYCVTLYNGEESIKTVMCDYASASNEWSKDEPGLFNVYI